MWSVQSLPSFVISNFIAFLNDKHGFDCPWAMLNNSDWANRSCVKQPKKCTSSQSEVKSGQLAHHVALPSWPLMISTWQTSYLLQVSECISYPPPPRENVHVWLGVCRNGGLQRHRPGHRSPAVWGRSHRVHHRAPGDQPETNRCTGDVWDF